jgi:long-chain acyl-CoA synthetase
MLGGFMRAPRTIKEYLKRIEANASHDKLLNYLYGTSWQSVSKEEMLAQVRSAALALRASGLNKGDAVAIYAYPSIKWTIANLAIIAAGGVAVPIFINISPENFKFQIEQTEAKIVFIDGAHFTDITYQNTLYNDNKARFKTVIAMNANPDIHLNFDKFLELGENLDKSYPELFEQMLNESNPDDISSIVYTSGSTGVPKGAEYTQEAIFAFMGEHFFGINENDRFLSFLPLAHIYGYVMNLVSLLLNLSIYYLNDPKLLAQAAKEVHPTVMIVVPRLLEKLYAKLLSNIQNQGFMKKTLGLWAFQLANHEDEDYFTKHLLHPLADVLIYSKFRDVLGSNVRIVISGSAPLNPVLNHFFNSVGIPIFEGYGMTEACPITLNQQDCNRMGSVGRPLPIYQAKTSEEGELMFKGLGIMRGYYKDPRRTAETITSDGWLKTGDKGTIDADGYVYIVGRLKELYKTSTGEFVAPVPIEQELIKVPLIESSIVIAEGRKFTTALLFPDLEVVHSLKLAHNSANMTDDEFLNTDFIKTETRNLITEINKHVNKCEQIQDFRYIVTPLTIEAGELTPTLKIRREVVAKKYEKLIDSMYTEERDS